MTRRHLLLFSLLAGLLALGVDVWLLWPRSAVTRENFAKLRVGMTLAEVEEVLGEAAQCTNDSGMDWSGPITNPERVGMVWRNEGFAVRVEFEAGRVRSMASRYQI